MKDIVQGLGLTEIFARLCPGLILLSSLTLWLPRPPKALLELLKQYELVLLAMGLIAAYTLGLILETGSGWLAHRYLEMGYSGRPPETDAQRVYDRRLRFLRLLVGFVIRKDDTYSAEGRLRMVEQLEDNGIEIDLKKRFSLLDLLWVYRTLVAGPLGERAQPVLRVTENIRARLLFALGVGFSLLLSSVSAVVGLLIRGFGPVLKASAATSLAERFYCWETCWLCIVVATVGVGVSALLRLAMARFWDQELFFTSSLTWYVHSADGLLTRRQGTGVVPFNVATL